MDFIRRVRLPAVLVLAVVSVVVLPWAGWDTAGYVVLVGAIALFYWLPGLDSLVRNVWAGYREQQ